MSFTLFDREGKEPLGLPQLREPCVCSPADTYCLVCRVWDCEQKLAKEAAQEKTVRVCFADGKAFNTTMLAATIMRVHALKAQGFALRAIPQILGIKYTQVRAASRMRLLEGD